MKKLISLITLSLLLMSSSAFATAGGGDIGGLRDGKAIQKPGHPAVQKPEKPVIKEDHTKKTMTSI